ncbi:MAG: macro domain-containing protein [Bdellovibrionota bacterium]
MIFEQVDQIFEHYPECIVHPVSCTGVAHDVLSRQIKKSYPDYFREYTRFCIRKRLIAGQAHFYALDALFGTKYIVTLIAKNNWQEKVKPPTFKQAFDEFLEKTCQLKISTIAMPKMEDVPQSWLKEQFEKASLKPENTIERVIFF